MACACGSRATQVLGNFSVVVKHAPRVVSKKEVTDAAIKRVQRWVATKGQAKKRREKRAVEFMRGLAHEQKNQPTKGIGKLVASMPVRYVQEHNIDRGQGWLGEQPVEQTKKQLKEDGLWFGS